MTTIFHDHTHTAAPQTKTHEDCTCKEAGTSTCCSMMCFERPNYFCGHLLTDADLSLGQKYLIEKQKLYHRALDGWGVVCGLRLTCDHQCPGHINVGEGYAIDDCGNDLVVCETRKVDVIGILREKGYLVAEPPPDPCKKPEPRDECPVRQCFFITACYEEEPGDFTTPFRTGCGSGPVECEPTRIRERVRFDVVAEAPKQLSAIDEVQERIEACTAPITSGPIAKKLKEHDAIFDRILAKDRVDKACEAFCELRVVFLQHLRRHPDHYNCETEKIVRDLDCPKPDSATFLEEMKEALETLLGQIDAYVANCVINEAVVPCPSPAKARCVLLGTVEVENGTIRRVCNTPRRHLWTPANFIPSLLFKLLTGALYDRRPANLSVVESARYDEERNPDTGAAVPDRDRDPNCCPDVKAGFIANKFLRGHKLSPYYTQYKATAPMTALRAMTRSLYRAFDFTNSDLTSMRIVGTKESARTAEQAGFAARESDFAAQAPPNPLQAFARSMLQPQGYPGVVYRDEKGFEYFAPDYLEAANLDLRSTAHIEDRATVNAVAQVAGTIDSRIEEKVSAQVEQAVNTRVEQQLNTRVEQAVNTRVEQQLDMRVEQAVNTRVEQQLNTQVEQAVNTRVEQAVNTRVEQQLDTQVEQAVNTRVEQQLDTRVEQAVNTRVEQQLDTRVEQAVNARVEQAVAAQVDARLATTVEASQRAVRDLGNTIRLLTLEIERLKAERSSSPTPAPPPVNRPEVAQPKPATPAQEPPEPDTPRRRGRKGRKP